MTDELRKAADELADAVKYLETVRAAVSWPESGVAQALAVYRAAAKREDDARFVAAVNAEMERSGFAEANRKTAESEHITEEDLRKIVR